MIFFLKSFKEHNFLERESFFINWPELSNSECQFASRKSLYSGAVSRYGVRKLTIVTVTAHTRKTQIAQIASTILLDSFNLGDSLFTNQIGKFPYQDQSIVKLFIKIPAFTRGFGRKS